ncbi:MAG: flagellar hook protein FlgE [Rhizobiaceae bacterium]|nr:flagellar hook protein FlgE [Rhizobiaceae bacterium]
MSLYGMMRTGVSGMNAQSNRLGTVADNIANSNTTGYKRAKTEFSSLVIPSEAGSYSSGGVKVSIRNNISKQGVLQYTGNTSDLAISGDGFFIVQDQSQSPFLMRAGSFVPDGNGRLVNAAGFYLMGYSSADGDPSVVTNGFNGLEVVSIANFELSAEPSTQGTFTANFDADEAIVPAANLPSANAATAEYSHKSSMVAYDDLGSEVLLDVYFTKTAANTWEVAIYNRADAAPGTTFPYTSAALATETLDFDGTTGRLAAASADDITLTIPGGQSMTITLGSMSQFANPYTVYTSTVNGNSPAEIESVEIASDGTVFAQYENGSTKALYRIPLATVQSPDQLQVLPGNVYTQGSESGDIRIGFPNEGKLGSVVSGALEGSNVDIAEELTDMIEAQRNYTANSKVFQTGSDLLDILVNLKR